jgi:hypothetical protein
MSDPYVIPMPTKDVAENYIKNLHNEISIENRIKIIADKIDQVYKEAFHVEVLTFNYICHFKTNNTIIYKISAPGFATFLPEMPVACLWSDTDLHITLEMMKSDFHDAYVKLKKARIDFIESTKETFWQKIKRGLGF